jgi:chromosome segregation ATPase
MDASIQKLTGERDTLTTEVARLTNELQDSLKKAAEDADKIRELTEKVGEHEKEIARLTQEIDTLTLKEKNLLASDASKQAEIDALAEKEKELKEALEREKQLQSEKEALEKETKRLQDLVDADKLDISEQTLEKLKLMEEARKLRETIAEYERQVTEITEKLQKGILEHERQVTTRIWKIHDKVDDSVKKKLTASQLLALLQNKKYIEFRDAVKKGAGELEKKEYNLPALFLIYESIGGTWSLFERLADTTQTTEFMTEKLIESLRLFQTIEKHNEHLLDTYTNQYFKKFLETFELLVGDGSSPNFVIESF